MRQIIIAMAMLLMVGCATVTPIEVCQVPPELKLVPQGSLTLPAPSVTLVTPEDREPYFVIEQMDFFLLLDNNKQVENYILESRERSVKIKKYYEDGIRDLRDTKESTE
jgi:hypothetical protein